MLHITKQAATVADHAVAYSPADDKTLNEEAEDCDALDVKLLKIKRQACYTKSQDNEAEEAPVQIIHARNPPPALPEFTRCAPQFVDEALMQQCRTTTLDSLASFLSGSMDESDDEDFDDFQAQPPVQETTAWGIQALHNLGYELREMLSGSGCMGVVRRATRRSDGGDVAVRCVCSRDEHTRQAVRNEYELVSGLRHHSVAKYEAMFESRFDVWVCMELCVDGDLQSYVDQHGAFQEAAGCNLVFQLIEGVNYLHKKRVAHSDLKPAGLLLQSGASILKIADFSMARPLCSEDHVNRTRMLSDKDSSSYAAPELRSGKPWNERVDIWSSGLCAYFILSGRVLVSGEDRGHAGVSVFEGFSASARHFVEHCVTVDLRDRPTAMELLLHPIFWHDASIHINGVAAVTASHATSFVSRCEFSPICGLLFCGMSDAPIQRAAMVSGHLMPMLSEETLPSWKERRSSKDSLVRLALSRWGHIGAGSSCKPFVPTAIEVPATDDAKPSAQRFQSTCGSVHAPEKSAVVEHKLKRRARRLHSMHGATHAPEPPSADSMVEHKRSSQRFQSTHGVTHTPEVRA